MIRNTMDPAKRARHRRLHYCTAASGVLAAVITWLLSQRHAQLAVATTSHHQSLSARQSAQLGVLFVLFLVLDVVLTLVTFAVASIAASRHRARAARARALMPVPRRRRDVDRRYAQEERR